MKADNLTICDRCGSDACFVQEVNSEIKLYSCFGCGFQTNSVCKVDSDFLNEQMETLPNLYKELAGEDKEGKVWIPNTVQTDKGIVFAKGSGVDDWKWAAAKYKKIDGKNKMDMVNVKEFEEQNYMDALEVIGVFDK